MPLPRQEVASAALADRALYVVGGFDPNRRSSTEVQVFDGAWPQGIPVQIHMMEGDEWVLPPEQDLAVARQLAETVDGAELFLYPGDRHLFADSSLPDYDESAATLLKERVLGFLTGLG